MKEFNIYISFLAIFTLSFTSSDIQQKNKQQVHHVDHIKKEIQENDSLLNLELNIYSTLKMGNEYQNFVSDFKIIKEEQTYYACSQTSLHVGNVKETLWKQKLTKKELKRIQLFLEEIQQTPSTVSEPSFYNEYYTVSFGAKKWRIEPDGYLLIKDINNRFNHTIDFPSIDFFTSVFKKEIERLEEGRNLFEDKILNDIARKWYYNPDNHVDLTRGTIIHLQSYADAFHKEYWEIINMDSLLKNSGDKSKNDELENLFFKSSQYYTEKEKVRAFIEYHNSGQFEMTLPYLSIFCDCRLVGRTDLQDWENSYSFSVLSLTEDELILEIVF